MDKQPKRQDAQQTPYEQEMAPDTPPTTDELLRLNTAPQTTPEKGLRIGECGLCRQSFTLDYEASMGMFLCPTCRVGKSKNTWQPPSPERLQVALDRLMGKGRMHATGLKEGLEYLENGQLARFLNAEDWRIIAWAVNAWAIHNHYDSKSDVLKWVGSQAADLWRE